MEQSINIGSGWTVLSTECWLSEECSDCAYYNYCYPNGIGKKPIMKIVVDKLYIRHGEPSEKLILAAVSELNTIE